MMQCRTFLNLFSRRRKTEKERDSVSPSYTESSNGTAEPSIFNRNFTGEQLLLYVCPVRHLKCRTMLHHLHLLLTTTMNDKSIKQNSLLIVDDELVVRDSLSKWFKQDGY